MELGLPGGKKEQLYRLLKKLVEVYRIKILRVVYFVTQDTDFS
jgi:hypothetical protein